MSKILIVVDAPGPAEFILPVIPRLTTYNLKLITVGNSPTKILAAYKPLRIDSEAEATKIYTEINPDILLVAMSSLVLGPYVNQKITELAHADKKKIICFQDYWANHRHAMNFKMLNFWDVVLVPDELAKNYLLEDGYSGQIVITGNPGFDRFRDLDVAAERKRLRAKFGIAEGSFVILHSGTGTPQSYKEDEITFNFLAKAVRELSANLKLETNNLKLIFISRPHPRDEEPGRYQRLAPDLNLLDTSTIPLTEDILPIADLSVAMYSTNLIHACYMRIPGISILLPNAGLKRLEKTSLQDFPPNNLGATIGIYEESVPKLKNEIEKIISDSSYRNKIIETQKKYFKLEGELASVKVADVIS
ncbi:MAG: hypothetical protein G01um10143_31 [Parcubacteria group bacterium Gr01-1014_3]|nr:MAG: hypothetical protein G01um10143_31 [Parcubacteria group bacterium Gr01-1014_3]